MVYGCFCIKAEKLLQTLWLATTEVFAISLFTNNDHLALDHYGVLTTHKCDLITESQSQRGPLENLQLNIFTRYIKHVAPKGKMTCRRSHTFAVEFCSTPLLPPSQNQREVRMEPEASEAIWAQSQVRMADVR